MGTFAKSLNIKSITPEEIAQDSLSLTADMPKQRGEKEIGDIHCDECEYEGPLNNFYYIDSKKGMESLPVNIQNILQHRGFSQSSYAGAICPHCGNFSDLEFIVIGEERKGCIPEKDNKMLNRYDIMASAIYKRFERELKWKQIEKAKKTISRIEKLGEMAIQKISPLCWDYIYSKSLFYAGTAERKLREFNIA